jgi:hypothetical protein
MKKLLSDNLGFHVLPIRLSEFVSFGCPESRSDFLLLVGLKYSTYSIGNLLYQDGRWLR